MKKILLTILLIMISTVSFAQIMKRVQKDEISDLTVAVARVESQADVSIYITKKKKDVKYLVWYSIDKGDEFNFTYKIVPFNEPHNLTVYIVDDKDKTKIQNPYLNYGFEIYLKNIKNKK